MKEKERAQCRRSYGKTSTASPRLRSHTWERWSASARRRLRAGSTSGSSFERFCRRRRKNVSVGVAALKGGEGERGGGEREREKTTEGSAELGAVDFSVGHYLSNCVFLLSGSLVLSLTHSTCTFQSSRP